MNPSVSPMTAQFPAPSMSPGAPSPAIPPAPELNTPPSVAPTSPQGLPQDAFMLQQPPMQQPTANSQAMPSEAELAALMNMLGAPQAASAPEGLTPPAGPGGAPSSLQTVPGPNGGNMVLESNALPLGAPSGSLLRSPLAWLAGITAAAGAVFIGLKLKNKNVAQGAFEKLSQNAEQLKDQIAGKLGRPDELASLHTETAEQVKNATTEYNSAINGIPEKQEAADLLSQKTDALFEHAKSLPEGGSLKDKVFNEFTDAIDNFKTKILGQNADEAAKASKTAPEEAAS